MLTTHSSSQTSQHKIVLLATCAKKTNVREAKKICAGCPVKEQCLEYGLTHVEYGVWGGLTANERRTLNRKRRAEAASGLTKKVAE